MAFDGIPVRGQVIDANGDPVSGAKIYFKKEDTTTDQAGFTDRTLATPAANPVVADSAGQWLAYISPLLSYYIEPKSADDATTYNAFYIGSGGGDTNDAFIVVDTTSEIENLEGADAEDVVLRIGRSAAGDISPMLMSWKSGDQSALVTNDAQKAYTVAPSTDATGASGVWHHYIKGAYNVRDFGATGDGSTDDTTAVLAAVAHLSGQDALYFPAGTYVVDDTMDFTGLNEIAIFGDGIGATIIKRTDGTFGDTLLFQSSDPTTTQAREFTIRDLTFECAADMTTGAVIHMKNVTRIFMDRFFLRNYHRGIHLEGIRDSRFDNFESVSNEYHTTTRGTSCHLLIDVPADTTKESTEVFFSNFNMTTASPSNPENDLDEGILIQGKLDGIWFNGGHIFGGKSGGLKIDGNSQSELQGLYFNNVWFDQYTEKNVVIQGTATTFGRMSFTGCRLWGGSDNNLTIDTGSGLSDISFNACEIGVTQANGCIIGSGQVSFNGCIFKEINTGQSSNGYALQVPASAGSGTVLTVSNCEFEMSNLYYGIWCVDTAQEYHLSNCSFRNQGGVILAEISFNAAAFVGSCGGHTYDRDDADDIAAATSTRKTNIVSDIYNLTGGSTISVDTIEPYWHGREIVIRADGADQTLVDSTGNLKNTSAGNVTRTNGTAKKYYYSETSARWHEL